MKSITVFNNKGGVGKTTFLCNIAAYLSHYRKKKVLIIDADPQCNATYYLLGDAEINEIYKHEKRDTINSFFESIKKGKGYSDINFNLKVSKRFDVSLIPGDPKFALTEDFLASDWKDGIGGDARGLRTTFVFKELLNRYKGYDYIFFDVGPSLGAINRTVLIASDYFIVPISSDIFSLLAISNISNALDKWKEGLNQGLRQYENQEDETFVIEGLEVNWGLKFAGYVTQQYTAKSVGGIRRPVRAYDQIIRKIPDKVQHELIHKYTIRKNRVDYKLSEIPNLHSIIPLSQTANAPIFELCARDGVVGAHFAKVQEAKDIYKAIAERLITNIR